MKKCQAALATVAGPVAAAASCTRKRSGSHMKPFISLHTMWICRAMMMPLRTHILDRK